MPYFHGFLSKQTRLPFEADTASFRSRHGFLSKQARLPFEASTASFRSKHGFLSKQARPPFRGRAERRPCSGGHDKVGGPCLPVNIYPFDMVKMNSSPPVEAMRAKMVPPWKMMAFFTMASPRPVPPSLRERPLSMR